MWVEWRRPEWERAHYCQRFKATHTLQHTFFTWADDLDVWHTFVYIYFSKYPFSCSSGRVYVPFSSVKTFLNERCSIYIVIAIGKYITFLFKHEKIDLKEAKEKYTSYRQMYLTHTLSHTWDMCISFGPSVWISSEDIKQDAGKFVMSQIFSPHLQPFPTAPPIWIHHPNFSVVLTLLTTQNQVVSQSLS